MGDDINISSSSSRVEGDKAKDQAQRLAEIEARQAADRQAADAVHAEKEATAAAAAEEARIKREQAEAQLAAAAKAAQENADKLGAAAAAVGGVVAAATIKGAASKKKFPLVPIIVIAIIAVLAFLAWPRISAMLFPQPEPHTITQLSENTIMNNTRTEFANVILGEAREKQELVVWEQDVEVESAITQSLANLEIFSKTKVIHSFGTGVYTVNMGKVDENAITVDTGARVVTLTVPRTTLQYITKDLEKTEFEDTQRGWLGFGEVKLTQEQQNLLERSIEDSMREQLEDAACFADADKAALLVVYDVYAPLITKIDSSYTLKVAFPTEERPTT